MATTRTAPDPIATASATASSTNIDTLPRGRIGRDTLSANSTGTTTTEVVCAVSPTVGASRTVHIHANVTLRSNTPGGVAVMIFEDGVQIQRKNSDAVAAATDVFVSIEIESQPSTGAHTYQLVTGVSGGAGNTVTAIANGAAGTHGVTVLYVDDVGPSY